jgi:hypothetical protein
MTKETWRDLPPYDYEARRERAEAHCRTQQHGRHIDTLPLEPRQPPLTDPPAFPWLQICGGEPCVKEPDIEAILQLARSMLGKPPTVK